jgi:hypothetical protein
VEIPPPYAAAGRATQSDDAAGLCARPPQINPGDNEDDCEAANRLGIKQVSEHIWLVSFMDYDLGYFFMGVAHSAQKAGAGLTNMHLGLPDLGFMDLSQVVEHTIAVRGVLPEESLGRLLFLDNNLYEVGRRTGLFAMNPGQSPCDCFLLIVVYRTLG